MPATRDRLALVENISSIGGEAAGDLRETLDRIVSTIAAGMDQGAPMLYRARVAA